MAAYRSIILRATTIVMLTVMLVGAFAAMAPGANTPLTKKKALKLFYKKGQAKALFVGKGETRTGHFSCNGLAWQEVNQSAVFSIGGTNDLARTTSFDNNTFHCNAALPNGAVITGARFALYDLNPSSGAGPCTLRSSRLTAPIASGETILSVGETQGNPGDVVLSASPVSNTVVDTENFSYVLSCQFFSSGGAVGVYGAIVDYTVTGDQGAAS